MSNKSLPQEKYQLPSHEIRPELWLKKPVPEELNGILYKLKEGATKNLPQCIEKLIVRFLYHTGSLPFNEKLYDFEGRIGDGGQSRVYFLKSKQDDAQSWVIKTTRPEKQGGDAAAFAKNLQAEHAHIKEVYKSVPELMPEQHVLVMSDPFYKGHDVATILQHFERGEITDLFSLTQETIADLMKQDEFFKNQLISFCRVTLAHYAEHGETIDLLGKENVSVVKNQNVLRLKMLDPHPLYASSGSLVDEKDRRKRLGMRVEFVQDIMKAVDHKWE